MKIGILYCGGCNPTFDRTKYITTLKNDHPEHIYSYAIPGESYDRIVGVCGCPSACLARPDELSAYTFGDTVIISDPSQPVFPEE